MKTRNSVSFGLTARILLFIVLFALKLAPVARAAVTTVSYWRMGEIDSGVSEWAVQFNQTLSSVAGGPNLPTPCAPWYRSTVSGTAAARVGSHWCLYFPGVSSPGTVPIVSSVTDNFGIELWVKPDSTTSNSCLAYNGNTSTSGWGLYQFGNSYAALFGGKTIFGSGAATAGVWTQLALVRDNGQATLYVNGVPSGTSASAPN